MEGGTLPMEQSPAVATASLNKRNPESDPAEETEEESEEESGEESGESGDYIPYEDEETRFRAWWKEPEWDVDSFDDLDYDSSEHEKIFDDEELERKLRRFHRQLIENKVSPENANYRIL